MAEDGKKPVQADKKPDRKMVPQSDLEALRVRAKRTEGELAEIKVKLLTAEAELKVARVDEDDAGEISTVKQALLNQSKQVQQERVKLEQDLASFKERERGVVAKELVTDLKLKGVEVEIDTLLGAEDMNSTAKDLYAEHLAKENTELKEKAGSPEGGVYETGSIGLVKKQPKDMSKEEFNTYVQKEEEAALSKK